MEQAAKERSVTRYGGTDYMSADVRQIDICLMQQIIRNLTLSKVYVTGY